MTTYIALLKIEQKDGHEFHQSLKIEAADGAEAIKAAQQYDWSDTEYKVNPKTIRIVQLQPLHEMRTIRVTFTEAKRQPRQGRRRKRNRTVSRVD